MNLCILFLTAAVISAIGFIMYVYFFSVGYGFSITGISIALLILFRENLSPAAITACILLALYGARLGGYLLYRELNSTAYKTLLKNESKSSVPVGVKCAIWISCAILYTCMTAPVLFCLENQTAADAFSIAGIVLMVLGIVTEFAADLQKSHAKKTSPGRFVSTGLYRFVRCPNYFGELLLWTGVFVFGIRAYHGPLEWIMAVLGYVGIIYVMFSGARRLELRQDKNYGADPTYQNYVKTTPIIIPFLPVYSVSRHKWLVA